YVLHVVWIGDAVISAILLLYALRRRVLHSFPTRRSSDLGLRARPLWEALTAALLRPPARSITRSASEDSCWLMPLLTITSRISFYCGSPHRPCWAIWFRRSC